MKVTAEAVRSGNWWAVHVLEIEGVFTQARRLDQVAAMAADAVATMLDIDPGEVEVEVLPQLVELQAQRVKEARLATQAASEAQQFASVAARSVVRELRADGLSTRDVAAILGVSHQRVSQLVKG